VTAAQELLVICTVAGKYRGTARRHSDPLPTARWLALRRLQWYCWRVRTVWRTAPLRRGFFMGSLTWVSPVTYGPRAGGSIRSLHPTPPGRPETSPRRAADSLETRLHASHVIPSAISRWSRPQRYRCSAGTSINDTISLESRAWGDEAKIRLRRRRRAAIALIGTQKARNVLEAERLNPSKCIGPRPRHSTSAASRPRPANPGPPCRWCACASASV
jgi:hypothetical protein